MHKNFRTYQLAIEFYRSCQGFKLDRTRKDQFDRALLSIPLNLSEGAARPTQKDRRRFYFQALGSLREVQTLLELFGPQNLIAQADVLGAHLYRLCQRC